MQIYFHYLLWSYWPRVPIILTTYVYVMCKMWFYRLRSFKWFSISYRALLTSHTGDILNFTEIRTSAAETLPSIKSFSGESRNNHLQLWRQRTNTAFGSFRSFKVWGYLTPLSNCAVFREHSNAMLPSSGRNTHTTNKLWGIIQHVKTQPWSSLQ